MEGEWTTALAPVAGLAVNTLSQIASAHILRRRLMLSIIIGILFGLVATFALIALGLTASLSANLVDIWLLGTATYIALSFGFWAFLNLNVTSLRIRILREIRRAGGSMAMADLFKRYSPRERMLRRLNRLRNGGQLLQEGEYWRLRSRQVLVLVRCVEGMRMLVFPAPRR